MHHIGSPTLFLNSCTLGLTCKKHAIQEVGPSQTREQNQREKQVPVNHYLN